MGLDLLTRIENRNCLYRPLLTNPFLKIGKSDRKFSSQNPFVARRVSQLEDRDEKAYLRFSFLFPTGLGEITKHLFSIRNLPLKIICITERN
ncbi:MAG: hypothetical protein BMS9Abin02_1494 [Anaerolineae bacterium]|nr:MAG: hypothetical protein BMS9Abin02_1494 [Anaerolineae bacterium]